VKTATTAYDVAARVRDPELPMLTLADLGILREVTEHDGAVVATITPTYSGCPAMREISADLEDSLRRAGFADVTVRTRLAPPWSSDWITSHGRRKLAEAGIAPPAPAPQRSGPIPITLSARSHVTCPRCGADDTVQTAAFSATACKSLHRCRVCDEPFEQVKPI
jgi:ring-1,2-phenylacetyl-CoA epoxidase subunit PaaD